MLRDAKTRSKADSDREAAADAHEARGKSGKQTDEEQGQPGQFG